MKKESWLAIATIVEIIGVLMVAIGIGVEIGTGASPGVILITFGSMVVALGSLLYFKVFK